MVRARSIHEIPRDVDDLHWRQLEAVKRIIVEDAEAACKDITKTYYRCWGDYFVFGVFMCRDQKQAWRDCLRKHTTNEIFEAKKQYWVDKLQAGEDPLEGRHYKPK
eukprot:TRINITY_DN17711_c0_g1::TRINITY_DN17711_c0_g1_i1::g.11394::m.11394 TRINITY_DN17711_c0_g1::TRINITY_DN17711_c0_g1_i1::g.11394  ORF type:complete len:106 (-),score=1.17,Cmc1/PF08583.5/1.2e-11,COX17/PF05051.8/5.3,COX17/PF05051.8/34,Oscp1/PF10188.4/0.14 TRINITY_DN17711_c0_g1_i1:224-541(-)